MKRCIILMTIDQAKHYTPEQCDEIAAAFLPHEREARAMGAPVMGSGRVFHIEEASIRVEPFLIPVHWPQINGIDFGWDHPFAAVNVAWDRDGDVEYVCKEYRETRHQRHKTEARCDHRRTVSRFACPRALAAASNK